MHITLFSTKMGWLDGKGINLHPWGSRINAYEWHGLLSTLECWLNIPYLHSQPKLSAYLTLSRHNRWLI